MGKDLCVIALVSPTRFPCPAVLFDRCDIFISHEYMHRDENGDPLYYWEEGKDAIHEAIEMH